MQVTEDSIEDIWRHHGLRGLARLLLDLAVRVPAEHLAELWQDIRYGVRMLAASPGFTLVALTSLSLGICAATSAFSKLNATVFRNLPHVSHPEALVAHRDTGLLSELSAIPRTPRIVFRLVRLCRAGALRRGAGRPNQARLGPTGHPGLFPGARSAHRAGPRFR